MNVPEEFADLRKQFQKLHTELDQNVLFLDICHWRNSEGKNQTETVEEQCKVPFELLGHMNIPLVNRKNHSYLFEDNPLALFGGNTAAAIDKQNRNQSQYHIVGFPEADQRPPRRPKVAYLRCPNEMTRNVAIQFRALAEQAGAALPASVSDAIPALDYPKSYIENWLAFIFWQCPPSIDDLLCLNSPLSTHLFTAPCDVSARAIEECDLNSANPVFRPRKDQWPEWAGWRPEWQPSGIVATESIAETSVVTTSSKTKKGTVHASRQDPPSEYRRHKKQDESPLGPITGIKAALGYALHRNKSLTDQGYRDQFHKSVENGTIWVRKSESEPRKYEMFIRATSSSKADADQKKVKDWTEMVNQFESRLMRRKSTSKNKSSKVKQSQTKRTKVKQSNLTRSTANCLCLRYRITGQVSYFC